jgi:hypothetical protein
MKIQINNNFMKALMKKCLVRLTDLHLLFVAEGLITGCEKRLSVIEHSFTRAVIFERSQEMHVTIFLKQDTPMVNHSS